MGYRTSLVTIFALTAYSLGAFAGAGSSGGADPNEIQAPAFSDAATLAKAISLAETQVAASKYTYDFKKKVLDEIQSLRGQNKYLELPSLIVLGNDGPEGYSSTPDVNQFISLGGMTLLRKGANIYFAERVHQYSLEKFTEVLVHEVIHHVLHKSISIEEKFVAELASSLINGTYSKRLDLAVTTNLLVREDGTIPFRPIAVAVCQAMRSEGSSNPSSYHDNCEPNGPNAIIKMMGKEWANDVSRESVDNVAGWVGTVMIGWWNMESLPKAMLRRYLPKFVMAFDLANPWVGSKGVITCKEKGTFDCKVPTQVKDLLEISRLND